MKRQRDRCDHCKKWIAECHGVTLEGLVPEGIDFNFAICDKCSDEKGYTSKYWTQWVKKQEVKVNA